MRIRIFGLRTAKEILRDPMSLIFGLGFPLILLGLMTLIQKNIPVSLFEAAHLTPGITAFGLSFLCLFTATLVAKDRSGSLIARLRATPMRSIDFFLGYLLPLLPVALLQMGVTYLAAILLGLEPTLHILPAILVQLPLAVFHLSCGILCGCLMDERQVGGICGALLTNLSAWLSGAWFDLKLVGGALERIAFLLPFANATEAGREILAGGAVFDQPLMICCLWAFAMLILAAIACKRLTSVR